MMRRSRRNSRTLQSRSTDTLVCVLTVSDIFLTCYNDEDFLKNLILFTFLTDPRSSLQGC